MGAGQSGQSRSVNVDNPSPVGVIDVSEEVVQRLKVGLAKSEQQKSLPTPPQTISSTKQQPIDVPITTYQNPQQSSTPHHHHTPAIGYFNENQTITAIDVRRQKEIELQQNDLYWRKRMGQLEQTLNKTNQIMEKEYSAAVDDVRKSFTNAPPTHQLPPCQTLKANLIACYRVNRGEPLKCSEEVSAFTNCVGENRINKLDNTKTIQAMAGTSIKIPPKAG